jgi:hypothetical protein|tara:strand:- start:207 stop:434 length:228 start_codon:yes stop_codon:yes gene_type:complete
MSGRNYRKEYDNYHSRPEQKKNRASRNTARALIKKKKGSKAVAGKDVHHKDRNPSNNSIANLRIKSKSANRSQNG